MLETIRVPMDFSQLSEHLPGPNYEERKLSEPGSSRNLISLPKIVIRNSVSTRTSTKSSNVSLSKTRSRPAIN